MQEIKLISIDCIDQNDGMTLGNESVPVMTKDIEKRIREFNKESLKNERQAKLTDGDLLLFFYYKKQCHSMGSSDWTLDRDNNTLEFRTFHYYDFHILKVKIGIK